jgi:hypothetical protein
MTAGTRLTAEGILYTNGLDEITKTSIGQNASTTFAAEFDEVTLNPIQNGLAKKEYVDGRYQVAGYFDEYTGF